jgi:predicted ATPase with chaperone activity
MLNLATPTVAVNHRLSSRWVDGPVVRAALGGGLLILDGMERVERNVLPLLNNLLENGEMQLEVGV